MKTQLLLIAVIALLTALGCRSVDENAEHEILIAVRDYLAEQGEVVTGFRSTEPPEDYLRPPVQSDHCFPRALPSPDLISRFAERSREGTVDPATSVQRAIDWAASKAAGTEPTPEQGFYASRAAVDHDQGYALIYVEQRAPLAGFAAFFYLKRADGWRVIDGCILEES